MEIFLRYLILSPESKDPDAERSVEVCDSVDLDRVRRAIENGNAGDAHLQRFVFYRSGCRPVNLRLLKGVENLLLPRQDLRRALEKGLKGASV